MSESTPVATAAYTPAGFCPRCGFRTDPGMCPDCGRVNRRVARRDPTTRFRRWVRIATRAAVVVILLSASIQLGIMGAYRWWPDKQLRKWSYATPKWRAAIASDILKFRDARFQAFCQRIAARLDAEEIRSYEHCDWSGTYTTLHFFDSTVAGMGGQTMRLGADGTYLSHVFGCFSAGFNAWGRVSATDAILDCSFERPWISSERWVRCTIFNREALISAHEIPMLLNVPADSNPIFSNAMSRDPTPLFLDYLPFRWPDIFVPTQYERFRLRGSISVCVERVVEWSERQVARDPDPAYMQYEVALELDAGLADGLIVGIPFWWRRGGELDRFPIVTVVAASTHHATARGTLYGAAWKDAEFTLPGATLTSGRHQPGVWTQPEGVTEPAVAVSDRPRP